jgi:hypothetical protein
MQIFSHAELDVLPWPAFLAERPLLEALLRDGPQAYIANVSAAVRLLLLDELLLPLTVVDASPAQPNAYVCSPTTHYIAYARREVELELADQPLLRALLPPLLESLRPLLRWAEVERAVYVNNWLLSTNLYPAIAEAQLAELLHGLVKRFPSHSIVFRSLNEALNGPLIAALERLGCQRVFSRQVYLLDPRDGAFRRRNSFGNDRRLARRSPYSWLRGPAIPDTAAERLCELYAQLYIDKYSIYNPQLTPRYLAAALRGQWLRVAALAAHDRIDGVLGVVEQHGVITAPLLGYERARDPRLGLYRLLMLELIEQGAARGRVLHLSSGAAEFKRMRGAEPAIEYSLVYHAHLPPRRRLPWCLLGWLSRRAVIPLMRRFGL